MAALAATVVLPAVSLEAQAKDADSPETTADTWLLQGYVREIQAAISRNRLLPDSEPEFRCVLDIEQAPGGVLIASAIGDPCDATEPVRRSLLTAIRRAEPLPYAGFEPVFRRTLRLTFQRDLDP